MLEKFSSSRRERRTGSRADRMASLSGIIRRNHVTRWLCSSGNESSRAFRPVMISMRMTPKAYTSTFVKGKMIYLHIPVQDNRTSRLTASRLSNSLPEPTEPARNPQPFPSYLPRAKYSTASSPCVLNPPRNIQSYHHSLVPVEWRHLHILPLEQMLPQTPLRHALVHQKPLTPVIAKPVQGDQMPVPHLCEDLNLGFELMQALVAKHGGLHSLDCNQRAVMKLPTVHYSEPTFPEHGPLVEVKTAHTTESMMTKTTIGTTITHGETFESNPRLSPSVSGSNPGG
ncbi:cyclin-dependent kinase D1 [Striga asiatica]|uniref:Cyclin-dependent kinase D1 n=1 Tax=Striga asiatica TaxID=4170 RepID=A0A5A7RB92_STRAF|nr:cyclin-dependent kinase D1 [Striga asiatica]